jgi:hypothetical protein
MTEYRKRRKANGGKPLGSHWDRINHNACDKRIKELEEDNRRLREMLPF